MAKREPAFAQILEFDGREPVDHRAEPHALLDCAKQRLKRLGALEARGVGPLGFRQCKIGRCQVDGLYWERAVRRLERRGMYELVSRFEPVVFGLALPEVAQFLEAELIAHARWHGTPWRTRFRNKRGGSAGAVARSGQQAIYLAIF